jgi:hypothetical protein
VLRIFTAGAGVKKAEYPQMSFDLIDILFNKQMVSI